MTEKPVYKIGILASMVAITVAIHYGFLLEPLFGESHWTHAIHGRFCYIPIVISAIWFGLRGGLIGAFVISILVAPYVFFQPLDAHTFAGETVEIIFYFALAALSGALIDRESLVRRKLEQSEKLSLVGRMAAGVAHEIKNPLASIKGAVEIISSEKTELTDRKKFSEIVISEIRRMDNTVRDFLDFAKPRKAQLHKLNLGAAVNETVIQLGSQFDSAGVTLNSSLAQDIHIAADKERIHQLILNLALNALDACQNNGSVTINTTKRPTGGAILTVTDTGSGLTSAEIEKIFEPFYTTKSTGAGLGLAIVKSIVDEHHSAIRILSANTALSSHKEQGVTVEIEFPEYQG